MNGTDHDVPLTGAGVLADVGDLVLQLFHTFFQCLRHAGKIDQCSPKFHNEMQALGVSTRFH